jgi:hypothetical protein
MIPMASSIAFMIPVDFTDFKNSMVAQSELDARPQGWCTDWSNPGTTDWWMNENVSLTTLSGASLASARVGYPANVNVGIQGTSMPVDPGATVQQIQAWAFWPYTTPGPPTIDDMLPSMKANFLQGTPTWTGSLYVPDPDDTKPQLGYAPQFTTLENSWTPITADLMGASNAVHCCLVATCYGTHDDATLGVQVKSQDDLANLTVCTSPYVGQKNIAVLAAERSGGPLTVAPFGFLAGVRRYAERTQIAVEVRPVESTRIHPAVLRDLSGGPFGDLTLRPAGGAKRLHLRPNEYAAEQFAERSDPAEQVVHDGAAGEDVESGHRRLRLGMPPRSVQPLLLEIELDDHLPGGSVFECDIIQTGPGRGVGGIRLAVVVPE